MTRPGWWKSEITPGNVLSMLTTLVAITAFIVLTRADVQALQSAKTAIETRIDHIEARAEADRRTLYEMQGDIRVIRQILEGRK